jgi:hypothetical protein
MVGGFRSHAVSVARGRGEAAGEGM